MGATNRKWTEEEVKMAINIYCKIPFISTRKSSPEIIKWANIIGRSPGALYTKLCNLGSFDTSMKNIGVRGLSHTGKIDEIIWKEFENNPEQSIYESEQLLAKKMRKTLIQQYKINPDELPVGKEREIVIRQRVNQEFFRRVVLMSYGNQCCITGISHDSLLEACHISSWKYDIKNRTNPRNGLCMNPLFHKAFDSFLFAVSPDYHIDISERMIDSAKEEKFKKYLSTLNGEFINMPEKFLPDKSLLALHYENYKSHL